MTCCHNRDDTQWVTDGCLKISRVLSLTPVPQDWVNQMSLMCSALYLLTMLQHFLREFLQNAASIFTDLIHYIDWQRSKAKDQDHGTVVTKMHTIIVLQGEKNHSRLSLETQLLIKIFSEIVSLLASVFSSYTVLSRPPVSKVAGQSHDDLKEHCLTLWAWWELHNILRELHYILLMKDELISSFC